jgi:putative transposase
MGDHTRKAAGRFLGRSFSGRSGSAISASQYTATATELSAHEAPGLLPLTTPAYNCLAEAFVKTFKRDYVDGAELRDAESVFAQLSGWIEAYNTPAPNSALGMRSPADYRAAATLSSSR